MDYIYSKLNNNLVDINRLDKITLLKCEKDDSPIEGLKVGEYYLKFTVIDSDKVNYCSLADLNKDDKDLLERLIRDEEYFGERCLYKSETNASKWESKEGSLIGYLGNQSESAVKASVGFTIDNNIAYLPSYPNVVGTYYAMSDADNSLTGKLNLTPVNGVASPLLSFSGTGALSMGTRSLYLDNGWFAQSTDNISLKIPAKSGTLITEADAMGSVDVEVDDLETSVVYLTDDQFSALRKYPKSVLALKYSDYNKNSYYRYFAKLADTTNGVGMKFVSSVESDNGVKVGVAIASFDYDKAQYRLDIAYVDLVDSDKLIKIQKISYGFYPTIDSDNNVTLKSYKYLTESETEALEKFDGSYALTDNGYPAFVKTIDDNTVLIEDLGVCKAEINRTLPHNKRVERLALELTKNEIAAVRSVNIPRYKGKNISYTISAVGFDQKNNAPILVFNNIYLKLNDYDDYGFASYTVDNDSFIEDNKFASNYYFDNVNSSVTDTSFTIQDRARKFVISGDINDELKRVAYWFIPGDAAVGKYVETTIIYKGNNVYTIAWTEELAALISNDIDISNPLTIAYNSTTGVTTVSYVKTDGTQFSEEVDAAGSMVGRLYFKKIVLPSKLEGGKDLTIIYNYDNQYQNTFIKYTSLLGKVTQSDNYKLEQDIADNKTAIETEVKARETEVQELREECSNITQGIQEFSNSVDIKFQEKEEEITKNSDAISAEVTNRETAIASEETARKAADTVLDEKIKTIENGLGSLATCNFIYLDQEPQ